MPRRHIAVGALVAGALVALVVVLIPRRPPPEPPPVLGGVSDFTFTDQAGRPFASASELRGRAWVADFIFTRCTTVCPLLTERLAHVEEATRKHGDRLRLVSFSVDPDFDKPAVLADYARAHHAESPRWFFLTGDVAPVAAAMKIAFERQPGKPIGESVLHGTHLVLLDKDLRIRGYYDSSDPAALQRLIADAGQLAK